MSFYREGALASREWTVDAAEPLTVDLRRAGPHDRTVWAWRGGADTVATASVAIADAPAAEDWYPEGDGDGAGMQMLTRPAAWLRVAVTGSAATVQLIAPGPVEASSA